MEDPLDLYETDGWRLRLQGPEDRAVHLRRGRDGRQVLVRLGDEVQDSRPQLHDLGGHGRSDRLRQRQSGNVDHDHIQHRPDVERLQGEGQVRVHPDADDPIWHERDTGRWRTYAVYRVWRLPWRCGLLGRAGH